MELFKFRVKCDQPCNHVFEALVLVLQTVQHGSFQTSLLIIPKPKFLSCARENNSVPCIAISSNSWSSTFNWMGHQQCLEIFLHFLASFYFFTLSSLALQPSSSVQHPPISRLSFRRRREHRPESLRFPAPHLQIYLHCTILNLFSPLNTYFIFNVNPFFAPWLKSVSRSVQFSSGTAGFYLQAFYNISDTHFKF